MAIDQANIANRVIISLLNSLYNLGQLPKDVFFKLFNFTKRKSIEVVHRYAFKRYMCIGLSDCNAAVFGDCGRLPT